MRRPPAAPQPVALRLVPGVRRAGRSVRGVQVEGGGGDAEGVGRMPHNFPHKRCPFQPTQDQDAKRPPSRINHLAASVGGGGGN